MRKILKKINKKKNTGRLVHPNQIYVNLYQISDLLFNKKINKKTRKSQQVIYCHYNLYHFCLIKTFMPHNFIHYCSS